MKIEKIDINDIEVQAEGVEFKPYEILEEATIRDDEEVKPNPAIILGYYSHRKVSHPIIFGSYGDVSLIVGPSKSMKTKLKLALCAGYMSSQAKRYFPKMTGIATDRKYILDLDTEQSRFHVKRNKEDVLLMAGLEENPYYQSFNLRKYTPDERYAFLEWLVFKSEYAGKIGLLCVDGAADLINDTNDNMESNKLASLFMRITDEANCHLLTILHRTKSSSKPTGHIGSAILKKAETVVFVERQEDDSIKVTPEYTRNYPFLPFSFKLNEQYLPTDVEVLEDIFED